MNFPPCQRCGREKDFAGCWCTDCITVIRRRLANGECIGAPERREVVTDGHCDLIIGQEIALHGNAGNPCLDTRLADGFAMLAGGEDGYDG